MRKTLWSFAVAVMALVTLAGCHVLTKDNGEESRSVKVKVLELNADNIAAGTADYVGTIEAKSSIDLGFASGGRLKSLAVKEGQRVGAGQLIATVDNNTAQSSYNAAAATLSRAEDAYRRAKQVYEKGSLPEVKWVEVQTQLDQARSLAEVAKKNLGDCALYAPRTATVANTLAEVGAMVSPMQPVVRLMDLSSMYAKMSVPEGDIGSIAVGDTVEVAVNAIDGRRYKAVIESKEIAADAISHSYLVRARLTGKEHKELLPGMVCRITTAGKEDKVQSSTSLIVPNRAVQLDNEGKRYVWIVNDSCIAEQRYVTIGDLVKHGVVVTSGIEANDKIITDGTQKIASGTKVEY